jgi:hypothetical protein
MSTREQRIRDLLTYLGADTKDVTTKLGVLSLLNTSNKASLVSAINEVAALSINDTNDYLAAYNTAKAVSIEKLRSTLANATVQSPILREDMWAFLGATYGNNANFTNTSVVLTDGPDGVTTKVLNQAFPSNSNSNYGMPSTGTGIALTSTPLIGGAVNEASIEYDFRAKSAGVPWGLGGKLPGLGGVLSGHGGVPSGGSPSPYGWSGRCMWRRQGTDTANLAAKFVGYVYDPTQTGETGSTYGQDRDTKKLLNRGQWHHIKIYYKMNTIATESSAGNPDGIHRIYLDGALVYENLAQVYRLYKAANITHIVWDNFYGGATDIWGPTSDTDQQFDNLVITTYP